MKIRFGLVGMGALALGMAGCAGSTVHTATAPWKQAESGRADVAASPSYPSSPATSPAAPPSSDFGGGAPATSAPPAREEAERSPSQRPGLGTEWGETRFSQVHEEPFVRAADDPFALATVRYDDRSGVDAMTGRRGRSHSSSAISVAGGWVSMSVRGERGDTLDAVKVGDRTYVVGHAGERYSLVLSNRTSHRFEAVATVDGLDVINGQTGSLTNRGYLLDPHATLEIDGFRQSDNAVAAFRFGRVADSYAAQTGSARDVGVIGVAFFAERGARIFDDEARLRDTATPFPGDGRYARPPF